MQKKNIRFTLFALFFSSDLFFACSNSTFPSDSATENSITELCHANESGDIYYQSHNSEYFICQKEKWVHVDIKEDSFNSSFNSRIHDSISIKEKCTNGDKWFHSNDSLYTICANNQWKTINEIWKIIPISERFLPIEQGKYIPNANFNTPFTLIPPQPLHNGIVRCSFNGSEPDNKTDVRTGNVLIDSTTVVRCTEFIDNKAIQKQTETYFINESISMPVLSISVDPNYLLDYLDAKPCKPDPCRNAKFWEEIEYPAHIEYFANGSLSNSKNFEIDAGISIIGHGSRNQEKKSISVHLRKEYQKDKLIYPLFDVRPEKNTFKAFILRNNGQRFVSDFITDAIATNLLEGSSVDYQRSKHVVVFYNGLFHGIYDMREKLNEHFIETNYDISKDDVTLIKHVGKKTAALKGNEKEYQEMLQYIYNSDFSNNSQAYDSVTKIIDIASYIEYMAAEIYYHNGDWPHNNVRIWRSKDSPWKFMIFDIDHGFNSNWEIFEPNKIDNMFEWIFNGGNASKDCANSPSSRCFHMVFKRLVDSPTFRQAFINRANYLYATFINEKIISNKIDSTNKVFDVVQMNRDLDMYNRPNHHNFGDLGFDLYGDNLKNWAKMRDRTVKDEFREFFKLGEEVPISIEIKGNAHIKLDNIAIPPQKKYTWNAFRKHPIYISVECQNGASFKSWENGSSNPNRTITPQSSSSYTAECI